MAEQEIVRRVLGEERSVGLGMEMGFERVVGMVRDMVGLC